MVPVDRGLIAFLMAAANFWGLLLVIVFMGCGLVAIPRKLWSLSDRKKQLKSYPDRLMRLKDKLEDAQFDLDDTLKEAKVMALKFPQTRISNISRPNNGREHGATNYDISEAAMIKLNNKTKMVVRKERKYRWKLYRALQDAVFCLDLVESQKDSNKTLEFSLYPYSEWTMRYRKLGKCHNNQI
ncbi:LMBR1 domain-containing protein 2 [Mycoemilia scoparia]|uniref:LMBR1 domain-containing protein 2 n=1 Tax=Mycoemilia scoparia TaxID=417184 RepID=A0A9W8A084_9FUNG|nr:LMBR1 domain-containing protein 2 [Mycoemilia scoparia]